MRKERIIHEETYYTITCSAPTTQEMVHELSIPRKNKVSFKATAEETAAKSKTNLKRQSKGLA